MAVDKTTEKRTYMNMFGMGVALGLGGKFYQQVVLFESKQDFDTFVNEGWEATSEAQQLQAKMPKSSLHSSTAALPFISSTQKAYLSMQTYLVQNTG